MATPPSNLKVCVLQYKYRSPLMVFELTLSIAVSSRGLILKEIPCKAHRSYTVYHLRKVFALKPGISKSAAMASIYGIPTHAVEEYEHESRLGDKESVEQSRYSSDNSSSSSILLAQLKSTSVTSVMGLDPSNLNNYRPLPPPVRAGAAIVRKYRDSMTQHGVHQYPFH